MVSKGVIAYRRSTVQHVCIPKQTRPASTGKLIIKAEYINLRMDRCWPFDVKTYGEANYFLTMAKAPQRFTNVEVLKGRSVEMDFCMEHTIWLQINTNSEVKRVHCDNAREFLLIRKESRRNRITMITSSPYSPHSNGLSESMNRILMEKVRAMSKEAVLNKRYLGKAVLRANHLHERTKDVALQRRTTYKKRCWSKELQWTSQLENMLSERTYTLLRWRKYQNYKITLTREYNRDQGTYCSGYSCQHQSVLCKPNTQFWINQYT